MTLVRDDHYFRLRAEVERPQALLEEIWRVLAPGGRMLVIAPNSADGLSPWATRERAAQRMLSSMDCRACAGVAG